MAQANVVLTSSRSAVMAQLSQINATTSVMQPQIKNLSSSATTIPKSEYFCWSCGSKFYHGRKACLTNKSGHKYDSYYKKRLGKRKRVVDVVSGR